LSSDAGRNRPRSSKKQRAIGSSAARRDGSTSGGAPTSRLTGNARPPAERVAGGRPRARSRPAGPAVPSTWLVGAAAVIVLVVAGLATGVIKLGGAGGAAAGAGGGSASSGPAGGIAGCPSSAPAAAPAGQTKVVTIATPKGSMELTLEADLSPIAVGNFLALASCGYFDDVVFHRVVPNFVIQGGDGEYGRANAYVSGRAGSGGPGYTIQDEPVTAQYGRGTVAMARSSKPNSVGSQFFIILSDTARESLASANTYQIIGTVTKGMEVADAIAAAADAEKPTNPIPMTSVTVAP
jgi:peptidyl-prolyl cis-trans isomerase B (cyclophilin B)